MKKESLSETVEQGKGGRNGSNIGTLHSLTHKADHEY
jgi:hypothetical protein